MNGLAAWQLSTKRSRKSSAQAWASVNGRLEMKSLRFRSSINGWLGS